MQTKTVYEEKLLREVQGLPVFQQERLVKIVHLLKEELVYSAPVERHIVSKEKSALKLTVYKCGGMLRDFSREDAYAERL